MSISSFLPFVKTKSIKPKQISSNVWHDRQAILNKDVNLFIWERSPDQRITNYLARLLNTELPAIQSFVTHDTVNDQIESARSLWEPRYNSLGDAFWQDINEIVSDFLTFSANGSGTFHLRIVDNNACTKFHIDGYELRLFATYYGQGTEWVPEDALDRSALGTTNQRIVKDESQIKRVGTGHIAILKGELPHRKNTVKGIVHRSPEITNLGEKRIILRIDI